MARRVHSRAVMKPRPVISPPRIRAGARRIIPERHRWTDPILPLPPIEVHPLRIAPAVQVLVLPP